MIKKLAALLAGAALMLVTSSAMALTYTYATDVRWDNGLGATPLSVSGSRYNQADALGSPNDTFLSLGFGGLAVFDFGVNFSAAAIVFETTFGNRSVYPEFAKVYVANSAYNFAALSAVNGGATISTNGFTYVADISNVNPSTLLDLSTLAGPFRYVLVQDITRPDPSTDGFDVNAVGVAPVPEPGTMVLLGAGLLGLAIFGKRRMNDA